MVTFYNTILTNNSWMNSIAVIFFLIFTKLYMTNLHLISVYIISQCDLGSYGLKHIYSYSLLSFMDFILPLLLYFYVSHTYCLMLSHSPIGGFSLIM